MIANLVKKESNIQKVIAARAESALPDRNRTKTFPVLKISWTYNSSFQNWECFCPIPVGGGAD